MTTAVFVFDQFISKKMASVREKSAFTSMTLPSASTDNIPLEKWIALHSIVGFEPEESAILKAELVATEVS